MITTLRNRARNENGFVLIVVLIVMLVAVLLGTAALAETLDSRTITQRSARVRAAQQATDAGIAATLYNENEANIDNWNLNGGIANLASVLDCIVPIINVNLQITGLASVAANGGVCPQTSTGATGATGVSGAMGNNTFASSEFAPGATNALSGTGANGGSGSYEREFFPKIVSLGWNTGGSTNPASWVYSRQEAILAPIAPLQAVEGQGSVSLTGLQLCLLVCVNATTVVNGNVISHGNLSTPLLTGGLNTTLSGGLLATLAYTGSYSGGIAVANLQKVSASSLITRPAPIISSTSDCSVAANCTALGSAYNSTYHTFNLPSGSETSATFASGNYYFCSFNAASGTTVNINPSTITAPVRILIRSPNDPMCAADKTHGDTNLGSFNDPAGFSNGLLNLGNTVAPSGFQVYVEGDGSYDDNTSLQVGPTSTSGLLSLSGLTYAGVFYAPTSKVTVNVPAACALGLICTGGVFAGSAIGNDTSIAALLITQDLDLGNYPLYDGIQTFRPIEYIQCDTSVHSLTGNFTTDTGGC